MRGRKNRGKANRSFRTSYPPTRVDDPVVAFDKELAVLQAQQQALANASPGSRVARPLAAVVRY